MKLIDYLNSIPIADRESFATRCDTSFDYLRQVGYGNRPCREALAITLERESKGELVCEELCPDVDWAFIRAGGAMPTERNRRASDEVPVSGRAGRQAANPKNIADTLPGSPMKPP